MCKLIDDNREGRPLIPEILPLVKKRCDEISDPEAREMAEKTLKTIEKMAAEDPKPDARVKEVFVNFGADTMSWGGEAVSDFAENACNTLNRANNYDDAAWDETFGFLAKKEIVD